MGIKKGESPESWFTWTSPKIMCLSIPARFSLHILVVLSHRTHYTQLHDPWAVCAHLKNIPRKPSSRHSVAVDSRHKIRREDTL
nr:unnamed protein product [Callosobruchus analis]